MDVLRMGRRPRPLGRFRISTRRSSLNGDSGPLNATGREPTSATYRSQQKSVVNTLLRAPAYFLSFASPTLWTWWRQSPTN